MENKINHKDVCQSIVEGIGTPLIVLNRNYEYVFLNEAAVKSLNLPYSHLIHKCIWEMFPQINNSEFKKRCQMVMAERSPQYLEEFLPHFKQWMEADIYPNELGITVSFKNITKRKEKELEDLGKIKRNSLMLENMGDLYILIDTALNIVDANSSACNLLGYTREELCKMSLTDFNVQEEKAVNAKMLAQNTYPQTPFVDTKFKSKSGSLFFIELCIIALRIAEKPHFGLSGRDVTVLHQANDLLKKSNDRFELLGQISQDGLWELDVETGKCWANEVHQNFYGLTAGDPVPGEKDWKSRIHPDDLDKTLNSEKIAIKNGTSRMVQEYRFCTENKGWIDIYDRTFYFRNEAGKIVRRLGSMMDITDLKMAERRLLLEKSISDSIINSLPGIFYLFDDKGHQLRWNENLRTITKYSDPEIEEMTPIDFIAPPDKAKIEAAIQRVREMGYAEEEARIITKDGITMPFYFIGKEVIIEGRKCVVGTGTDLTYIKAAEQKVAFMEQEISNQKLQHQKSISRKIIKAQDTERNHLGAELHDNINQLLAGTRLYLNMAAKTSQEAREAIAYPMQLLDETIKEIRLLTHKYVTPQKHVNLFKLINSLIENLQKSANITTQFAYEVDDSKIDDDLKINIYRILQEEATNIIKHSGSTKVYINLYIQSNWIHIITSDNGKGCDMSKENEGIGLANIINRVESFNGTIDFHNTEPSGFCIKIKIPVD